MKPFLKLKSVDEVLAHIQAAKPLPPEIVDLDNACGRVIAHDLLAPCDLPGFDRATVDGFALAARDSFGASETAPALLQLVGSCHMGESPDLELQPGQAAPILTGAMLPAGADCTVMLEYSRPAGTGLVELTRPAAPGENIVRRDEDAGKGSLVIPAGRLLRPQEIGCLAAFGCTEIQVGGRPEVAIISTGDEIVPADATPGPGQVRDVNSHSVAALCRQAGASVRKSGIIRDDPERLGASIAAAMQTSDVVIVSGGSSAGSRDFTLATFMAQPQAELIAHGVAISPGKPFILVRSGAKYLIGLPGHVSGALICSRVFVLPLLMRLQGAASGIAPRVTAALARSIASPMGRRDYIRCALSTNNDQLEANPLVGASALISSLVEADALAVCPENRDGLAKGEKVQLELLLPRQ